VLRIFEDGVMPALAAADAQRKDSAPAAVQKRSGPGEWGNLKLLFSDVAMGSGIVSTTQAWQNPHVRACVDANSQAIASLPLKIYRGRNEVTNHWLLDLFEQPNKSLGMSAYDLKAQTVAIREVFGECFWLLERGGKGGAVTQVWIYHPHAVTEIYDRKTGELLAWEFTFENERFRIDPLDVLQFKKYDPLRHNPKRPSRGCSPLHSAMLAVSADMAAAQYNLSFFSRGVAPGIILMTKEELGDVNSDGLLTKMKDRLSGKSGVPLVLDGGEWAVAQVGQTQKDAEFIQGRALNRADILETFKTVPVVVGNQDAKYDNAEQQLLVWWMVGLNPIVSNFCETINVRLLNKEKGVKADLSTEGVEVLQKVKRERIKSAIELVRTRVPWDVADRVFDLGLGSFEGSDVAFGSYTDTPIDQILAEPDPTPEPVPPAPHDPAQPPTPDTPPAPTADPQQTKTFRVLSTSPTVMVRDMTAADKAISAILRLIRGDDEALKALVQRYHLQALETGANQVADLVGVDALLSINNPRVVSFLETKANQIVSVNTTTANRINALVTELVKKGTAPEEIGREIRDLYNLRDEQATRIARNEVGSALNGGRYIEMEQEQISQHDWLTSRDSRVRDSHAAIDGEVVAIGEQFSIGVRYPQDPEGPPEQTIHCRCITLPVTSDRASRLGDRGEYWQRTAVKMVRPIEVALTKKLQRYLYNQRSAVLKTLADAGVTA
jgi:HK97 family phage portal protein